MGVFGPSCLEFWKLCRKIGVRLFQQSVRLSGSLSSCSGLAKACKVGVSKKLATSSYNWRWLRNFFIGLKLLETIDHYPLVKIGYAGNSNCIASGTHGGLAMLSGPLSPGGGDANTSFFHQQSRYHKRKNFVAKFQLSSG